MDSNRGLRTERWRAGELLAVSGAWLAGVLLALARFGRDMSAADNLLLLLLRPWSLLGAGLRAWSLSGTVGNAAAWAVLLVLSLLPCIYGLIARKKHKRRSDWMFPLLSGVVFVCLYLLVNPSLVMHPLLAASGGAEFWRMTPALVLLSALIACVLIRWAESLTGEKPMGIVLRWMNRLLLAIMLLGALAVGNTLADSLYDIICSVQPRYTGYFAAYAAVGTDMADAWLHPLMAIVGLIPQLFLIAAMHDARAMCSAFEGHGFHEHTEKCACALATGAKRMLIALCACMAIRNTAVMLMGSMLSNLSVSLDVPLGGMAFACGMLLLARCIAAACRIKRENELII